MGNYPFAPPGDTVIDYLAPSGDTTGATDAANLLAAAAAAPASGGVIRMAATAPWYIECGQVIINRSGLYIDAPGCYINAVGAGDMIRMYDSSIYGDRTVEGGGLTGFPLIDGTATTGNAAAFHAGDILQLAVDAQVQYFTAGTTSKGIWLDNNYYWTEQAYGRIRAISCLTGVMFDNSADTSGQATGSFLRGIFDIFVDSNGQGDGVTFNNGAELADGRLGLYGNFGTSPTQYAALKLTGSNGDGYSGISVSVINTGCELGDNVNLAPYTMYLDPGGAFVSNCSGFMDWTLGYAFTPCNYAGVTFAGTILGDNGVVSYPILSNNALPESISGNGQTIYTVWFPLVHANPGATSYTGIILQAGQFDGQPVTVVNEGTGTLTFDVAGTSNVADGTSDIIAGNTARAFTWDAGTSLWYRQG